MVGWSYSNITILLHASFAIDVGGGAAAEALASATKIGSLVGLKVVNSTSVATLHLKIIAMSQNVRTDTKSTHVRSASFPSDSETVRSFFAAYAASLGIEIINRT